MFNRFLEAALSKSQRFKIYRPIDCYDVIKRKYLFCTVPLDCFSPFAILFLCFQPNVHQHLFCLLRDGNNSNVTFPSDCSGSNDGKAQITSSTAGTLQRLRKQYENCRKVRGNLEITYITRETLNEEHADPATALQFLETIEEVSDSWQWNNLKGIFRSLAMCSYTPTTLPEYLCLICASSGVTHCIMTP